jgi:hypothetical protein
VATLNPGANPIHSLTSIAQALNLFGAPFGCSFPADRSHPNAVSIERVRAGNLRLDFPELFAVFESRALQLRGSGLQQAADHTVYSSDLPAIQG